MFMGAKWQWFFAVIVLKLSVNVSFGGNLAEHDSGTKTFEVPMAEVIQAPIYLTQNEYGETIVRKSTKGSDFIENDYLTHADDVRILNGGLDSFIKSGEQEVVVPVIDDEADSVHGEGKLLGFVMLTSVVPRKLAARRGEVVYDLEEGGPPPSLQVGNIVVSSSGTVNTDDKDYVPPPHGGGNCITERDCYYGKGACVGGKCECDAPLTGSYCQLYRPDRSSLSPVVKRQQEAESAKFHGSVNQNKMELEARAQQRRQQMEDVVERRKKRSEAFGFAFGKGPRLQTPLPTGPQEVRSLRNRVSEAGASSARRQQQGHIEKGDLQDVPSSSSSSPKHVRVETRGTPTLADLQRESAQVRDAAKDWESKPEPEKPAPATASEPESIPAPKAKAKTKMKGKNRTSKRYRKKQLNVIDDKKLAKMEAKRLREAGITEKRGGVAAPGETAGAASTAPVAPENVSKALRRFYK